MRFIERKVLETLLAEAAKQDYYPEAIEALGVDEDGSRISQDRLQTSIIIEQADAWDAYSEITFRHVEDDSMFWVQFVWGNGESVIHDYAAHPDAEMIMSAVNKEIDS